MALHRRPLSGLTAALACFGLLGCGPAAHDTIGLSLPYEVETLDPHARNTLTNFAIVSHFYEPLVTTDTDMKLRPCLAQLWENPDRSTWLFHLQPGVTFHSGKPLTARDVVYSLERLTKGRAEERLEMRGYALYITDVSALGPLTVRVRTSRPLSILLNKLRFIAIVPEGSTAASLEANADGTGPYVLAEWRRGERIRLTRNERYWGVKASLAKVEIRLDRSPETAAKDLLEGRSQLVQCNSRKGEADVRRTGRFDLARRPSLFLKYMGFDVAHDVSPGVSVTPNPFLRRPVREAMALAIDRERLVAGLSSDAVPANQLVPPSIFGFNPRLPAPVHDLGRARELLRQAGLGSGFEATLHVRKLFAEAAFLVRDQLRELGIRLTVKVLGDEEFLQHARRHELSLIVSRFGSPTGDASDVLDTAIHSDSPALHMGMGNYSNYSNPEVDRAIEESAGIDGLQARRAALERIMQLVMQDLPWVPLYVDQDVYAMDRTLSWQPRNDSFVLAQEISWR